MGIDQGEREKRLEELNGSLQKLPNTQLDWVERIIRQLGSEHHDQLLLTDLLDQRSVAHLGDVIRIHQGLSDEPFTKDKFEYALVATSRFVGRSATISPKGNPGHDITIAGERFSLKTEASRTIKPDEIHISKFMELGKGEWDLAKLRDQFLAHMRAYDRILTLRALSKAPQDWIYELVEIPNSLLAEAAHAQLEVDEKSKQTPKPGYCRVFEEPTVHDPPVQAGMFGHEASTGPRPVKFELYFDGGSERKLQIRHIKKAYCLVHATWRFPAVSLEIA